MSLLEARSDRRSMNGNDGTIRDQERNTELREKKGSARVRATAPHGVPEGGSWTVGQKVLLRRKMGFAVGSRH
jgi:hypothetical protein